MPPIVPPKDKTRTEHIAVVERCAFTSASKDWCILSTTEGHTVIGPADGDTFPKGTMWRWFGRWEDDPQRGPRFRFSTYIPHLGAGKTGVVTYLTRTCDGIGNGYANRLWDAYGSDAVKVLREEPDRVAADCKISPDTCREAAAKLNAAKRTESTRVELFSLFASRGFPGSLIERVIEEFDVRGPAMIRKNPFVLLDLPGGGFKRLDKLWCDLGLPKDALKRAGLCAWNLVKLDGNGHTWLAATDLAARLRELVPGADVKRAFKFALRARKLKKHKDSAGVMWLATYHNATAEERIAANIRRLSAGACHWPTARVPVSKVDGDKLPSAHQVERLSLATAGPVGLLLGGPGTGKAMPGDSPILTPRGFRPMATIRVGDEVVGSDGAPTRVIGVYPQGELPIYRVTFSDGASVECCGDHLWFTATRRERKNARRHRVPPFSLGAVRCTREIARTLCSADGHTNHFIPLVKPVQFAEPCLLPIDPYALGILLGDGHLGKRCVQFTTPDAWVAEQFAQLLPPGAKLTTRSVGSRCPQYQVAGTTHGGPAGGTNPVLNSLRELRLSGLNSPEKFVPDLYKFASPSARLAIIQGLLDTDGYTDGHSVEYSTSSPRLADDFVFLVESLGGTTTTSWRVPAYTHNGERRLGKRSARVIVKLPAEFAPFRLARKLNKYIPRTKYQPVRQIVSVEPAGTKPAQCIAVDAPDHLYVADRFVVTHNTHTLGYLLREVVNEHGVGSVRVAAPTGKASTRATQALRHAGLDIRAKTMHSTLEIGRNGHDGDGWGFMRNRANPLDAKFYVLDETSMVDCSLMADFLDAIPDGGHVLMVGDSHQLPPVGHGAPLRDLIDAGTPHGELTEVRRNAGQIVHACVRVKNGESFDVCDRVDLEPADGGPPRNLKLIEATTEEKAAEALVTALKSFTRFDPVWQTQVIVARNKKGGLSRVELNKRLHPLLNPDGYTVAENPFKVGDKIICLRNSRMHRVEMLYGRDAGGDLAREAANYDTVRDDNNQPEEVYVANGEIGRVVAIAPRLTVARFSEGDYLVKIPMGKQRDDDDDSDGAGGDGEKGAGCNFDLAYAVTGHRMQGSESPCVIVMGDDQAGGIASREWIYTAISRASKLCLLIGKMSTFDKMRSRRTLARRKTFVVELVKDALSQPTEE